MSDTLLETDDDRYADVPVLPDKVPVPMPELPAALKLTTIEQFRACSDPVRAQILGIIQTQPATAKQIADRLGATPGAIGHHIRMLEEQGLAQVVARRLMRGVVAKYYTRTARIFDFDLLPELVGEQSPSLHIMRHAWSELAEAQKPDTQRDGTIDEGTVGFPHVRLSPERAAYYVDRLRALVNELLSEPVIEGGTVYGVCVAMFQAPAYLQASPEPQEQEG
jgi:DNA-binding transcriptional ArsR family regulator